MGRRFVRVVGVMLIAAVLAGCDKCGHQITLVAPSLPKACGDNADPTRG